MAAELSAILVGPGGGPELARTFARLRRQSAADRLEVVLVGSEVDSLRELAATGAELAAVRTVGYERFESNGDAFARGFAAASAPLVVCSEEHSYPDPGWAQGFLDAAAARPEAVAFGASLACENSGSAVSWAHMLSDFGAAVGESREGWAEELPGHQTAYRSELLERLGEELPTWLEVEWILHEHLRARGEGLWRAAPARVSHLNISRLRPFLHSELLAGRSFAALRAERGGWSRARRLGFGLAAPLVLALRLWRSGRIAMRVDAPVRRPALLATLACGLTVNVAGQSLGALLGIGASRRKRLSAEIERYKHLRAGERRDYEPLPRVEWAPAGASARAAAEVP